MDALILSCGTGGGHNSAARAVVEELERRGHSAVMMNPYSLKSSKVERNIDGSYMTLAQRAPKVFGAIYKAGDLYRRLPLRSPVYYANGGMKRVMSDYLEENHFDIVIMPHLFPAEIMTNMRRKGLDTPKTLFVATDYACTPFTEETECDAYAIPADNLTEEYTCWGMQEQKLHPTGIPVRAAFRDGLTRQQARRQLGLHEQKKYLLISGGSMGSGDLVKAVEQLDSHFSEDKDFSMIIICGTNEQLYNRLSRLEPERVTPIRHTDRMAQYMIASDIFITKPGGLSSTEAAAAGVPLIHISPIPGCECHNMDYFERCGMSIAVRSIGSELTEAVEALLDPERASIMQQAQRANVDPSAAIRICDLAEELVTA